MYGRNVNGVLGLASTVLGAAVLPNTGNNLLIEVLRISTVVAGSLILSSFIVTKVMSKYWAR